MQVVRDGHVRPSVSYVTVQPGDTLWGLSQRLLGSGSKWPQLYGENRAVIGPDPNLIVSGERLAFGAAPHTVKVNVSTPTMSVSGTVNGSGLLAIAQFLQSHGYTRAAAAGMAGDIDGESQGNPESAGMGGGGLLGWTPISSASPIQPIITGNPLRDLNAQLQDILAYNEQQPQAQYLPELNAAPDSKTAGQIYSKDFERPAVLYSDTEPLVAQQIYDQLP